MSLNARVWVNLFFVAVQINDYVFETKSSSLTLSGVDPSPTFGSLILCILGECLVIGFLGGIFLP
jgi:hypothetical protein